MSFEDNMADVRVRLAQVKIVPVLALDSVEDGRKMADILDRVGLKAVEVTFRTTAAEDVIRDISSAYPGLCVGAGTVLNTTDLHRAFKAGATFAVAPGFNPAVVQEALASGYPFFPGVATPTEVEQALALGCRILKYFPAEAAGGTKMLNSMIAPYRHLGVRFMPTGGISASNVESYVSIPEVLAVGGTWLGKSADIAAGAWDQIETTVRDAVSLVASLKGDD